MFSLDGNVKYWLLYNKPVDMRKSFNGLSGIVANGMCASLRSGDVYIFMNASRNMMKMLRQEEGGLVLYAVRLDMGRMKSAVQTSDDELISSGISYEDMLGMVRSALDSPYVRRMKMLPFKSDLNGRVVYENKAIEEWLGMITSDLIDNYWGKECPEFNNKCFYDYLRDEFGFRCKHRLLFHWGFNARPWTDELEKKISQYGWYSDSKTVERFKQAFIIEQARRNRQANDWTERTFGFASSGKESAWANGLIALMYDVHLLGDWMPDDNSDFDGVTPPSKIAGDIVNALRRIDASRSHQIERALSDIVKSSDDECTMAVQMIKVLQEMLPSFLLMANDGAFRSKFEKKGFTFR